MSDFKKFFRQDQEQQNELAAAIKNLADNTGISLQEALHAIQSAACHGEAQQTPTTDEMIERLQERERIAGRTITFSVVDEMNIKPIDPPKMPPLSVSGAMLQHQLQNQQPAINEDKMRVRYGTERGHFKWDLAKAFFTTDNDTFFEVYGFNFVPRGLLFDKAKEFLAAEQSAQQPLSLNFAKGMFKNGVY
jgi:hypothetical protein